MSERGPLPAVGFGEAFRVWLKIGLLSFGGPAGQIALMHRILVEEKRWVDEERFLHALNFCMLLPGPEAQQLAVYIGWLLHRVAGGLVAGLLFVLPGALVMLLLSVLYAGFQEVTLVQAVFFGIKAAVLAVVIDAVRRIGRRALKGPATLGIAAAAFVAIFFFDLPFPLIVLAAGLIGWIWIRPETKVAGIAAPQPPRRAVSPLRSLRTLAIGLTVWLGPLLLMVLLFRDNPVLVQEGVFFSKMAVVTFGGAYAVLAYVAQEAVATYAWLAPGEMLDGLGMAETTPGPLIMVVQFVGFMGAFRNPGALDPMTAGALGALVTTWVTFAPCFLWIFLGAPYVEALRGHRALNGALTAITAAVVGVILNLAVWFALNVIFGELHEIHAFAVRVYWPEWLSLDWGALIIAGAALTAMLRFKVAMLPTLAASALVGCAVFYLRS